MGLKQGKGKYKKRDKGVPAENDDTRRTVRVLEETLSENPDDFTAVPPNKAGDPRWRGKPKPPRKPNGPDKPPVPRESPGAPIRPQLKKKPSTRMKPVDEVDPVKPMKDPKPSPQRRWKQPKRLKTAEPESVLLRFLQALERKA